MSKIHEVSDKSLIIEQEMDTWFINKKDNGIKIKAEFMTSDGYEEGHVLTFNEAETKALYNFLKTLQKETL